MGDDSIHEHLRELGFSLYEAKAYLALLRKSPVNGHELSRLADIPPPKIYETLRGLQGKGAVLVNHSEPVLYAPEPYRQLLARLRARMDETVGSLQDRLDGLEAVPAPGLTWSVRGYANLLVRLNTLIASAQDELYLALWPEEGTAVQATIAAARRREVRIEIALHGTGILVGDDVHDDALARAYGRRDAPRRLTVAVADGRDMFSARLSGAETDQGVWANNPVLASLSREYIRESLIDRLLLEGMGEKRYRRLCSEDPHARTLLGLDSVPSPRRDS